MQRGNMNFQMPVLSPFNKGLIISFASIFLIDSILGKAAGVNFAAFMGLSAPKFFSGHIYEILIYPFLGSELLEVLFDCLILWFIGSELEYMWGRKRYISFILSSTIGGGVIFVVFQLLFFQGSMSYFFPLTGLGGACNALLLAYGILFPDRTLYLLVFPIKAKYFCMILVAMQVFTGVFSSGAVLAWGHLGAMFSGFIFMFLVSNPKFKKYFLKKGSVMPRSAVRKSHLTLVDDDGDKDSDDNDPPKYLQ